MQFLNGTFKSLTSNTGKEFFKFTSFYYVQFLDKMVCIKIGTHNGLFHCDEALACSLLKLLPEYKDASIVRTRDLSILDKCNIVVDVGGKYDPQTHRYDHHMREFNESFKSVMKKSGYDSEIKLSSAGLVYCHFGHKIIKELIPELNNDDLEKIFKKVYEKFIQEIDALDNGVQMFDGEPRYYINTSLSQRVSRLNCQWNKPQLKEEEQFSKAMNLVREEFINCVEDCATSWLPALSIVKECLEKRFELDPSGEIIELIQFVPWKMHLLNLEQELNINPTIKYVIFEDTAQNTFRVQTVPQGPNNFLSRINLPEEWAGLRDDELSNISGIKDCIFVHSGKFIGGNKTRNGALEMAQKALKKFYNSSNGQADAKL